MTRTFHAAAAAAVSACLAVAAVGFASSPAAAYTITESTPSFKVLLAPPDVDAINTVPIATNSLCFDIVNDAYKLTPFPNVNAVNCPIALRSCAQYAVEAGQDRVLVTWTNGSLDGAICS